MPVRCGIIDDDALAISIIKSYIDKHSDVDLVLTSQHPLEIKAELNSGAIDLLFLDIEMPEITGFEFLQTLANPPKIVVTSAKKEYAAEGFDLDVLDYIVKPVTFNRFAKSIKKYIEQNQKTTQHVENEGFLYLRENKKMVKVAVDEILYVESIKDYIKVVCKNKAVTTKEQISSFFDKLPAGAFLRVHRSFLVAKKHIEAYTTSIIEIAGIEIPIGRNYKDECLKVLSNSIT